MVNQVFPCGLKVLTDERKASTSIFIFFFGGGEGDLDLKDLKVKAGRSTGHCLLCKSLFRRKWQDTVDTASSVSGTFITGLEGALASTAESIAKGFHSALKTMKNLSMIHKSLIHPNDVYLPFCVNPEIYPFPCFCSKRSEAHWCPKCAPHYTVLADPQH